MRARNERTYSTFRDKSLRAEALVLEMREDLKSLKDRLGNEVGDLGTNLIFPYVLPCPSSHAFVLRFVCLGIDGVKAEGLLTTHFKEQDKADFTDSDAAPPPKVRKGCVR